MKLFSATLCLAAAVCVAAQSAPEQGAQQSYFALAMQRDESQDTVSEFEYRGDILVQFNVGGFESQAETLPSSTKNEGGDPCKDVPNLVKTVLSGIDTLVDAALDQLPIPNTLKIIIKTAIDTVKSDLEKIALGDISDVIFGAVHTALSALIEALKSVTGTPVVGPLIEKIVENITPLLKSFETVRGCNKSKIAIEPATCGNLADIYRIGVKAATQSFPSANEASNEELKNLISAAVSILGLMDQSSIANSNDALLTTRPIFSASLLDQYRQEIVQKADSDTLKQFVQADLAVLISISNALEACLHVAADPEAAADELAEEYEAFAEDDEYDDE
ncbi:hypothetical protein BG015_002939 [Linnemannia schmuckeri]|uniref:Uncharacterized protein n=1 Tax=Linnemannia schmuckeri TaxID=64567 RepID=A0A9P5V621_9FUNG|nr:hypothetical protein BG015_002939 [Linnemannia schmuckeri]